MEFVLPILLILVGLGLVAAEVYLVPGVNLVGLLGFGLLVYGIIEIFLVAGPEGGFTALALTCLAVGGLFYALWTTGAWERFVLKTNLRSDPALKERETEQRSKYLGKGGTAVTPLRPTGIVEIGGERVEAQTEGEFIASGSTVRVVAMDRRRYFVRLATATPENADETVSNG